MSLNTTTIANNNISSTSSRSQWLVIWLEFVEPLIVVFGILNNFLIISIMPNSEVQAAINAKIYYVSIATVDFYNLTIIWLGYSFLYYTLYYLSGGNYSLDLSSLNGALCSVFKISYATSEL